MKHFFSQTRMFLAFMLLFSTVGIMAQNVAFTEKGMRKGMVKVKLDPGIVRTLQTDQSTTRSGSLKTGVQGLDKVNQILKTKGMKRLFPYNERIEHKLRKHNLHLWYVIDFDEQIDPQEAIRSLKSVPGVLIAEGEYEKTVGPQKFTPYDPPKQLKSTAIYPFNDPSLPDQWHYTNPVAGGADVNLFEAWKHTAGRGDIIVAVMDQGIDVNHEDLKANMWVNLAEMNGDPDVDDDGNGYIDDIYGFNFVSNRGDISPQTHGTHVAGTVAAVNNNGIGVSGVAGGTGNNDGVKLMSLQILGGDAPIEQAYIYAAMMGAVISQNSWGYNAPDAPESQALLDAIDYFIAEAGDYPGSPMKGGIVIFAAGNYNQDGNWYPQNYESVLAVSSIHKDWTKVPYSNYGTWVDIAAPGGNMDTNPREGILSTLPNNKYGYNEGTSMACPHVSGIAALAIANSEYQMTSEELRNRLLTGVVYIDDKNPGYVGKLGRGAIDAMMAIKRDAKISPATINDLTVKGVAQEFVSLNWTVPADEDDFYPYQYKLYYSTNPISESNLNDAKVIVLENKLSAGEQMTHTINNLLGLTTYYFAIISSDRWGNTSKISNIAITTTNEGPSIAFSTGNEDNSVSFILNGENSFAASQPIDLFNNAEGYLIWDYYVRNTGAERSWETFSSLNYPKENLSDASSSQVRGSIVSSPSFERVKADHLKSGIFDEEKMFLTKYSHEGETVIGEVNPSYPISGAVKFYIDQEDGFNLTQVDFKLSYKKGTGPVILEVYKGSSLTKENLYYVQEIIPRAFNWETGEEEEADVSPEGFYSCKLDEQLYFENGSTIWVAIHVPAYNQYPLGIGPEREEDFSNNCYYSRNVGKTWTPLSIATSTNDIVWSYVLISSNKHIAQYMTFDPANGEVGGNQKTSVNLNADGTKLINGTYNANIVFTSNDSENPEIRMPVQVEVSGQLPKLSFPDIVHFGDVFLGSEKTIEVEIGNIGYGKIEGMNAVIEDSDFIVENTLYSGIEGRSKKTIKVTYKPTVAGNKNAKLKLTTYNEKYGCEFALFGVGAETSEIAFSPAEQTKGGLTIGDEISAEIEIENKGKHPLKYFVPGFDQKGISDNWPVSYHTYGYVVRTNKPDEQTPISYEFRDISVDGTDITSHFMAQNYKELEFGFAFPYYGKIEEKIYISKKGFTTFDNTKEPINSPSLKKDGPAGYISVLGEQFKSEFGGMIHYKKESDHLIIQYTDMKTEEYNDTYTAQIVLHANGDIRFYYEKLTGDEWLDSYLNILIEDIKKEDGVLVSNIEGPIGLFEGMAIGFDYPGPDIITGIENASGLLMPEEKVMVKANMSTATLSEGTQKRFVNFVTNDPDNPVVSSLVNLEVISGGDFKLVVSDEAIDFGTIYKGFEYTKQFSIRNIGTGIIGIASIEVKNNQFTVSGQNAVNPGINEIFIVTANTDEVRELDDLIIITFENGEKREISLKANILPAPVVNADMAYISTELNLGEKEIYPFVIENTGLSELRYSVVGDTWLSFDNHSTSDTKPSYVYQIHNNGQPTYSWIDITETGIKEEVTYGNTKEEYWHTIKNLPFPVKFYGKEYTTIQLGESGIIALGEELPPALIDGTNFPVEHEGAYISPLWCSGGFSTMTPEDKTGLFYQFFEDKIVVSYNYYVNLQGMGDPIQAQAVIYKDGLIKFQYLPSSLDKSEYISSSSLVGIQNNPEEYILISSNSYFAHGKGLAFLIMPADERSLAVGEKAEGNIIIDASKIYAGAFFSELQIHSNDPANPMVSKPVELIVKGNENFVVPGEIDMGTMEVYQINEFLFNSYDLYMTMYNKGDYPVTITKAAMEKNDQFITLYLYDVKENKWKDIKDMFSEGGGWPWPFPGEDEDNPEFTLLPGDTLISYIRFTPQYPGDFEDKLTLTTDKGNKEVVIKAKAYLPPSINIDTKSVEVDMNMANETFEKVIKFDNINGKSELHYDIVLRYWRNDASNDPLNNIFTSSALKEKNAGTDPLPVAAKEKAETPQLKSAKAEEFNNKLAFVTDEILNDAKEIYMLGYYNGIQDQAIATRFTAGDDGFNVSDVGTWFVPGNVDGKLRVEIKVGGNSIYDALTVATGSLDFIGAEAGEYGKIYNVTLDNEAVIYPNEDFYVIFTYPYGIKSPQVAIMDDRIEVVKDRYLLEFHGDAIEEIWYDFQEVELNYPLAWVMYAAEKNPVESGWAKITGSVQGVLEIGESSEITLQISGKNANPGVQEAYVGFASNDTRKPAISVPVVLNMNSGPIFDAPQSISLSENQSREIEFKVIDKEGHTFTVEITDKPAFVSFDCVDGIVKLVLAPQLGDAGSYTLNIKGTDQYGAVTEISIPLEVGRINRAPVYTGDTDMVYSMGGESVEYFIKDVAEDPDGDTFSFNIESQDRTVANVYVSSSSFIVIPVAEGVTKLLLTLKDAYNATSTTEIDITVESCTNPEGIVGQKWNNLLYVSNSAKLFKEDGYQWYKNGSPISGAIKQYYSAGNKETDELDFTASYHVRLVTVEGKILYTCPIIPVRKDYLLRLSSNVLKTGETVTIEAQLPDLKSSPLNIQIVNVSGQVINSQVSSEELTTVKVPDSQGYYLINVSNGTINRTFNVTVE